MNKPLFNEFDAVSAKQWKQKIQFDLKGTDYNDALIWNTNHDISVKPFYHSEDFKTSPTIHNTKATEWKICETIFVADTQKSNLKAIDVLNRGAESIKFVLPSEDISISDLLQNIDTSATTLHFELEFLSTDFINNLLEVSANSENFHIENDIIGNLAKTGNWYKNLKDDFAKFNTNVNKTDSFTVDISLYENAGANIIQQLAYGLAHANEYLNNLNSVTKNINVNFKIAIGSNYFFEIAKLRAMRLLWEILAKDYNINTNCQIFAIPTKRNKTIYDYNTNMLRTTTECMSAVLGGANTICNLPHDVVYQKSNEFGDRMARNQLLILKNESYFNKVNNPADGTYYIEHLTNQFADKALILFKNIEVNGGFLSQLKEGTIQRKIKESAHKEQQQFENQEEILVGTNKYVNPNDKMNENLELYPFVKHKKRKTLIEPIIPKRLAETLEQKRLNNES